MNSKSLTHFLFFLCFLMVYLMYEQSQEIDDMREVIIKQHEAVESQALYIKILEMKALGIPFEEDINPIHSDPI